MTIGNVVQDSSSPFTGLLGVSWIGTKTTKDWFGDDSPARPRGPKVPKFYFEYVNEYVSKPAVALWAMVRIKDGKTILRKTPFFSSKWKTENRSIKATTVVRIRKVRRYRGYVSNPKPRRSVLADHAYTMNLTRRSQDIGLVTDLNDPQNPRVYAATKLQALGIGGDDYQSAITSNHWISLISQLRLRTAGSDFNLGTFIAEGKESLTMIFNAATRIDKSIRQLKRGDLRGAWEHLSKGTLPRSVKKGKTASANWLAMQYGWKPLLNDAKGAAEFLAHMSSVPIQQTIRVRAEAANFQVPNPSIIVSGWQSRSHIQIKAVISEVDIVQMSGLTDVASTAWEKLPFSFVADWFIPIGNFLAARGYSQATKAVYTRTLYVKTQHGTVINSAASLVKFEGNCSYLSVDVTRYVTDNFVVPVPSFKPLNKIATWTHAANAIALLVSNHRSS